MIRLSPFWVGDPSFAGISDSDVTGKTVDLPPRLFELAEDIVLLVDNPGITFRVDANRNGSAWSVGVLNSCQVMAVDLHSAK
jgi:hypothetical protein